MEACLHVSCEMHDVCVAGTCVATALGTHPIVDGFIGVLAFFIAAFSLAAGVGGGGLYVPLILAFLPFDAAVATALSQAMLSGGAIAALLYNLQQGNPKKPHRPLIDFELALLMGPALMAGAQMGSLLHDTAPNAFLLFLLSATLIDSARKSITSAKKISAQEALAPPPQPVAPPAQKAQDDSDEEPDFDAAQARVRASQRTVEVSSDPRLNPRAPEDRGSFVQGMSFMARGSFVNPGKWFSFHSNAAEWDEDEARHQARTSSAKIQLVLVWMAIMALVIGKSYTDLCSPVWWALTFSAAIGLATYAYFFAKKLGGEVSDKDGLDYAQLAVPLLIRSLFAGCLAAMCGIGGGMVMGPVLVQLKVPPPVSAATTATTLLVLSSSTAVVFLMNGVMPHDYSPYLCCCTASGALTGKILIGRWVRRTGKQSVIVWCLAVITVSSTILMGGLGTYRVATKGRETLQFRSLCHPDTLATPATNASQTVRATTGAPTHTTTTVGSNATTVAAAAPAYML